MFRRSNQFSYQYFASAGDIPPDWDELIPQGHYLQKQQLQVSETSRLPGISYSYVFVKQNGNPVAAVSFQALRMKKAHLNSSLVKPYAHAVWQAYTKTLRPVLLVAGHLFRHDVCSFYWKDISPYDAFCVYRQAIGMAMQKTCAAAVLVKDVDDQLVDYFQHHTPEYMLLRNDISMEMEIPENWASAADYEAAMKHKYAQRYRKVKQHFASLAIKELSLEAARQQEPEIYALYKQVTDRQQVRLGFLSPSYLTELKAYYGDQLKIWQVCEGDNMIAFFSAWVKDDVFDMFYIGMDYEKNATYQLYFNMLFFAVEQAIALKKKKLILGRTALDAKARIGCKPRYLHTFLYIKNGVVRKQVMKMQQNASSGEGEWEQRHPFRQS